MPTSTTRLVLAALLTPARKSPSLRWRWLLPVILVVVTFHFLPFGSPALDRAGFDFASRHPFRTLSLPDNSALVLVDQSTMDALSRNEYGMRWPFPRYAFAALIAALDQAGAERIVMDFTFFDPSSDAENDLVFGAIAAASQNVVLGSTSAQGPVFWNKEFVKAHAALFRQPRTGNVEFTPDEDGVMRFYSTQNSLAAAGFAQSPNSSGGLLRWHGGLEQIHRKGVPIVPAAHFIIAGLPIYERLKQQFADFSPEALARAPETIAHTLAAEPKLSGGAFDLVRGRTVFVGTNVSGTFDVKPLPVGKLEPGVLLHWTAWTNLVSDSFITEIPRWISLVVAMAIAAAVLLLAGRWPGLTVPAVGALSFVALLLPAAYAALSFGWFLSPATPAAAAMLTLLGVAAESFWTEQARKREIQAMFGAYVDPGVVAQLVRDPDSIHLSGERRKATVFFSDLAGFTDLSEKLKDKPELMVEIVNAYLDETSECLLNHGAYVDKYIGDAVMAVFGVPQPLPDHALAACRAALGAQRLIEGINTRYADATGVRLAVRIGLNTGDLIVGNVGSKRKKNYTVMGDTVNLASRLEGANKAFGTGILIGHETARQVQGVLATRPLARLRVKGKDEAVEVYALLGTLEDLSLTQREFLKSYLAGYEAYVNGHFGEASSSLARADGIIAGDLTTARLRKESEGYSINPPPPDWEPILTLESK